MIFNKALNINSIVKLLEIENLNHIDKSILDRQFRNLSKMYDPDYSEAHGSDRKMEKLKAAYEQALDNISSINDYLEAKNGAYTEKEIEETKPDFRYATFVEDSEPYLWTPSINRTYGGINVAIKRRRLKGGQQKFRAGNTK